MGDIGRVERLVGLAAYFAFRPFEQAEIPPLRQLDLRTIGVGDRAELDIGVVQEGEDVRCRVSHLGRTGQDLFNLSRTHVGPLAHRPFDRSPER